MDSGGVKQEQLIEKYRDGKGVTKDEEVVSGSYKAISTGLKDGAKVMVQKAEKTEDKK